MKIFWFVMPDYKAELIEERENNTIAIVEDCI